MNVDHSSPANPLHGTSAPDSYWSTTNVAEAMPGVLTPLAWSVWGTAAERALRRGFHALGAIPRQQTELPKSSDERIINIFYGRAAACVDYFYRIGNMIPGTSGKAVATQILGFEPPNIVGRPSRQRWPIIVARMPMAFLAARPTTLHLRLETIPWWRSEIEQAERLALNEARRQFHSALARFERNLSQHIITQLCAVQPIFDQISRLSAAAGVDSSELMASQGAHEEAQVVEDLWAVSRGRLSLEVFLSRHGYHGPCEGEISGVVWREDPLPVVNMLNAYRQMSEEESPSARATRQAETRRQATKQLLRALPRRRRALAHLLLWLAGRYLPLRGVGKVAFLQGLDVARAMARRVGQCLATSSILADPNDIFFLTADEIVAGVPREARALVAERRIRYDEYRAVQIPKSWQGRPQCEVASDASGSQCDRLVGIGASSGTVDGLVRVVTDPTVAEMRAGEILVAHTTDPSWVSLMFLSKALVTDIGGMLSHAAVVAREFRIPCVMGTRVGTRVLKTGDLCRIDGAAGTVEILQRAR